MTRLPEEENKSAVDPYTSSLQSTRDIIEFGPLAAWDSLSFENKQKCIDYWSRQKKHCDSSILEGEET